MAHTVYIAYENITTFGEKDDSAASPHAIDLVYVCVALATTCTFMVRAFECVCVCCVLNVCIRQCAHTHIHVCVRACVRACVVLYACDHSFIILWSIFVVGVHHRTPFLLPPSESDHNRGNGTHSFNRFSFTHTRTHPPQRIYTHILVRSLLWRDTRAFCCSSRRFVCGIVRT